MGKVFRYTKYGRKPRTAVAALKQARQFLIDEGKAHWAKRDLFLANRRNEATGGRVADPDNPLCGNWGVCAVGAVYLTATGFEVVPDPYDGKTHRVHGSYSEVADKAISLLDAAADEMYADGSWSVGVACVNDDPKTKRKDVIRIFDRAIEMASARA